MKTRILVVSMIWLGLIPGAACAASLPSKVLPRGVGVNIHFVRGHEKDLDRIAAAGIHLVRMDFGWEGIERRKGDYDWSAYDELTAHLERRGLLPYYILDYSNPLYEKVVTHRDPVSGRVRRALASPQHPSSVAACARWAAAAAKHYRGHRIIWEIYNEPNIGFWKPKPDVGQYTALALAVCQAVRAADPQATIVAPATSTFPWEFLDRFFRSGVLRYLDGVSVHPYRSYDRPPESAAADYARLRRLLDRYAPPDKRGRLPILSGEWGYATHTRGVSLQVQAEFVVRQQLSNLSEGVPVSIWYDWVNDGTDPTEREQNFGLVRHDLTPKPSYDALRTMTRELAGYRIRRRLTFSSSEDYALWLVNGAGESKLAIWTLGHSHSLSVPVGQTDQRRFPVAFGDGKTGWVPVERGAVATAVGPLPRYIALGAAQPEVKSSVHSSPRAHARL